MDSGEIICRSVLQRDSNSAPRYATISEPQLAGWTLRQTMVVEGSMHGYQLGRTMLRRSPRGHYQIELASPLCAKAQVDTGDPISLRLRLVDAGFPVELQQLIDADESARGKWDELSVQDQRSLSEHVGSARLPETRARRAREALVKP